MPEILLTQILSLNSIIFLIQYNNSIGNDNNKVNELYSLILKFSALGLLQDIRNNFHS